MQTEADKRVVAQIERFCMELHYAAHEPGGDLRLLLRLAHARLAQLSMRYGLESLAEMVNQEDPQASATPSVSDGEAVGGGHGDA